MVRLTLFIVLGCLSMSQNVLGFLFSGGWPFPTKLPKPIHCLRVFCPQVYCPLQFRVTRPGSCCPQCTAVPTIARRTIQPATTEPTTAPATSPTTIPITTSGSSTTQSPGLPSSAVNPPGNAQPATNPYCSGIQCRRVYCELDVSPITLPGQCCPQCPVSVQPTNCAAVQCARLSCPVGSSPRVPSFPPGQCCPVCLPNELPGNPTPCEFRLCPPVECRKPMLSVRPPGECCARCVLPRPTIDPCGSEICKPVICRYPLQRITRPGKCCDTCGIVLPDPCRFTRPCDPLRCLPPLEAIKLPGECCAQCRRPTPTNTCRREHCKVRVCPVGHRKVTRPGQCCPVCELINNTPCPGANEVFKICGSRCEPTCDGRQSLGACSARCSAGCLCRPGFIRQFSRGPCIQASQCPVRGCPITQQYYNRPPICISFCRSILRQCKLNKPSGCFCKPGYRPLAPSHPNICIRESSLSCFGRNTAPAP